uniref:Solute carrier family 25 member 48 n=1 Tax=Oryzias melastigma TaxID=30732 RepID=A0A3B3E012_ORYME
MVTGSLQLSPRFVFQTRLQAGNGYRNTLHCILTIYRKETAAGFFKGMSFPLASITVYNSVVFGFFSNAQRFISTYRYGDGRHPCSLLDLTAASMLTGLVSVGLGAPVDLVKIRLQMQTQTVLAENLNFAGNMPNGSNIPLNSVSISSQQLYRGPVHCVSSILQTQGLPGLYRGAGAMVLRDVPGYALYFIPYSVFCQLLTPETSTAPHPCSIWLAGGLAGSISWVTATPADVVKSRMQADAQLHRKYRGLLHCILDCYRSEGVQPEACPDLNTPSVSSRTAPPAKILVITNTIGSKRSSNIVLVALALTGRRSNLWIIYSAASSLTSESMKPPLRRQVQPRMDTNVPQFKQEVILPEQSVHYPQSVTSDLESLALAC